MTPKRTPVLLAVLVLFATGLAAPLAAQDEISVKRDVFVAAGETQDNVISFGGNVVIEGRVKQSVVAFGGTITVSGEVGEAVVGIGSNITLKPTAAIRGDVVSIGGLLQKEPGCSIAGDTVYFKASELGSRFFKQGLFKGIFAFPLFPIFLIIKLIGIFLWFIAALVVAALFPRPIARAAAAVRTSFWPVFWTGLLALVIFTGMAIFAALLCFILIGIPIAIALFWAGLIIKVFGRVVLFYVLGESLLKAFGSKNVPAVGAALAGLLVASLVGFIPFVGFLFTLVLSILGWGAALRTKFGTTDNWLGRKPSSPVSV
ncbi:MAG TPA: hypothetical protein VHP61_06120 [Acidobacteriota bacterium]|nr:hypothetical protein [Acidobacteriota bacterium]